MRHVWKVCLPRRKKKPNKNIRKPGKTNLWTHEKLLVAEVLTKIEILNKPGTVGCSSSISDITDYVVTAESKETR